MRDRIYRFMMGRNGVDELSRFMTAFSVAAVILSLLLGGALRRIVWYIGIAVLIWAYFRILSKKVDKRREENALFLKKKNAVKTGFRNWRDRRAQSKEYRFFRCPSCKAMLRVPRGKGKIRVTCRKCGAAFEKKT